MFRAIRVLSLRRLRHQPLRAAIAAVAVAAGISLAVAIIVVSTSFSRSVEDFGRSLAGPTPLRVVGATARGGLAEEVVDDVERTDGVAATIPLVQAVTIGEDRGGREVALVALGIDCRIEALVGRFDCDQDTLDAFATGDAVPITSPALIEELGRDGVVRTDVGRISLSNALVVEELDVEGARVVVFPMQVAQRLFMRPDALDVIYVRPERGASLDDVRERLEEAVGPWNGVLDSTDPPPQVGLVLVTFVPLFSMLGFFALGMGGVLVYNTVSLSLEERRRQLAIVAALGGTGRTVMGGTMAEAALLGLVGGLLGVLGGLLVAHPITASMSNFTERVAGIPLEVHVSSSTFVVGALLGLLVAVVAALLPARRALRIDVAAELSNREARAESAPRTRLRQGIAFTALALAGTGLAWIAQRDGGLEEWQVSVAPLAMILTTIGFLLAAAAFAPVVIRAGRSMVQGRAAPYRLAVASLLREPRRTGVMAVAIGAAAGTAFMTGSFTRSVTTDIRDGILDNFGRDVAVTTLDSSNSANIDAKISPDVLTALERVPGVARVDKGAVVIVGHEPDRIIGVSAFENPWLDASMILGTADRRRFEAGQVLIGPALARDEGTRPGDTLRIDTPRGHAELQVQGVQQNGDFGGRNVHMPYELLLQLYGPQPPTGINLVPEPGVSAEDLAQRVEGADLDPDLEVRTGEELADRIADDFADQMAPFWVLQRGLLLVAFVAVLSTLLLIGVQRRRELGLLAAVGMRPSELARMVMAEAGIVGIVGTVLGAIGAVVALATLLLITPILIGYRNSLDLDVLALLQWGGVTVAVAMVAAAWPARRTARVEVLSALQYE